MRRYSFVRSARMLIFLVFLSTGSVARAELVSDTDAGKKTMSKFMVNLAKFITWPDGTFSDPTAPYKYCIFGDSVMGEYLDAAMDGKISRKRAFEVSRMDASNPEGLKSCNVAFLSLSSTDEIGNVIDLLGGLPILTVGEIKNFAGYGGMIGFYGKGRKIALAINKKRLEAGGLKGSSKLFRASTM